MHPEKFPEGSKDKYQDLTQESVIENLKNELKAHVLRRTKRDVMGGRMPGKKERLLIVENSPTQKKVIFLTLCIHFFIYLPIFGHFASHLPPTYLSITLSLVISVKLLFFLFLLLYVFLLRFTRVSYGVIISR